MSVLYRISLVWVLHSSSSVPLTMAAAGLLLTYIDSEVEAFGILSMLMRDRGLRELYNPGGLGAGGERERRADARYATL